MFPTDVCSLPEQLTFRIFSFQTPGPQRMVQGSFLISVEPFIAVPSEIKMKSKKSNECLIARIHLRELKTWLSSRYSVQAIGWLIFEGP